jgi:hypothetical protein
VIYRAIDDGTIPIIDLGPDRRPLRIPSRWLDEQLAPDFERFPPLQSNSTGNATIDVVGENGDARRGGK